MREISLRLQISPSIDGALEERQNKYQPYSLKYGKALDFGPKNCGLMPWYFSGLIAPSPWAGVIFMVHLDFDFS